MDSDGSLIVDYITIVPPAAGAARQAPPMTIRSVYAKSKGTTTELDGVWIVQSAERNGQPMPLPGNGMVMWSGGTPTPCASDVRITFKGWLPQLQCPLAA